VRHWDGNPLQGVLPLTTVPDPFSAQPGQQEREWYDRIDTKEHPK
jgi:hypothetical protein